MKIVLLLLLSVMVLTSCSTSGTIQSREKEHAAAYVAFSPQTKALVSQGRIAVGMSPAAVYIAWGKPNEVIQSGDPNGVQTIWLYHGTFLEETRYWIGRRFPYLAHDYEPRVYVRAEVVFADGKVLSWRTLPQPAY